jgi:acetyltransferase-like isoleucine patch superfamily enzyme
MIKLLKKQILNINNPKLTCRKVSVGTGTTIWDFVNLYECEIGNDCMIGSFVEIQKGVVIGNRTRIQSHSFLCEQVEIGKNCFISHGVMFINDTFQSGGPSGNSKLWKPTIISNQVSIGSNVTIMPVSIGYGAVVGAGSVVVHDVPANAIVAGNPARILRYKNVND